VKYHTVDRISYDRDTALNSPFPTLKYNLPLKRGHRVSYSVIHLTPGLSGGADSRSPSIQETKLSLSNSQPYESPSMPSKFRFSFHDQLAFSDPRKILKRKKRYFQQPRYIVEYSLCRTTLKSLRTHFQAVPRYSILLHHGMQFS
jgi:hypothetical protein